ncbi:MAG: hypothetical protein ACRETM_09545 [Stenotrophobium sp.]
MPANSLAAVLLAALLLTAGVCAGLWRRMASLQRTQFRLRSRCEELRRIAEAREQLAAAQAAAEIAVQGGTATVRAIHKGIAAIPFTILENIPATRDTTRQVRRIHDAISEGIYSGITIGNKLLGHAARSAIKPPGVPSTPGPSKQPDGDKQG